MGDPYITRQELLSDIVNYLNSLSAPPPGDDWFTLAELLEEIQKTIPDMTESRLRHILVRQVRAGTIERVKLTDQRVFYRKIKK